MMFLWIPFLLLCPLAMFLMMRGGMDHGPHPSNAGHDQMTASGGPAPIEIARQRLARGEINTAQFDEIRRAIG